MTYLGHSKECHQGEEQGIGKQGVIGHVFQQKTREYRRQDLRCHRERIIGSGEFPHIAATAHGHDHRIGIHIDGCPCHTDQGKCHIDDGVIFSGKNRGSIAGCHQQNTAHDGLLTTDLRRDVSNGNIAQNSSYRRYHQTVGEASALHFPYHLRIAGKGCGHGIISGKP